MAHEFRHFDHIATAKEQIFNIFVFHFTPLNFLLFTFSLFLPTPHSSLLTSLLRIPTSLCADSCEPCRRIYPIHRSAHTEYRTLSSPHYSTTPPRPAKLCTRVCMLTSLILHPFYMHLSFCPISSTHHLSIHHSIRCSHPPLTGSFIRECTTPLPLSLSLPSPSIPSLSFIHHY